MINLTPNLNFGGCCEEALTLYQQAFQARLGCLLRYADAKREDYDKALTARQAQYVYHAELFIGDNRVMMCDNLDIPFQTSLALSLVATFPCKEDVLRAYDALKDGATILAPVHATTYSSCEVVLVDRFGIRWGLMTEQTER